MSEVEKALTDAYYWLSMYKSGAVPEGLAMEKVKEAIFDQPTLNENQQIVLDYLKEKCNPYSFIAYKPFEAIIRLRMLDPEKNELRALNTIDGLTYVQQSQVLQEFSQWALEREEEE